MQNKLPPDSEYVSELEGFTVEYEGREIVPGTVLKSKIEGVLFQIDPLEYV
jgi:hypothetical protein